VQPTLAKVLSAILVTVALIGLAGTTRICACDREGRPAAHNMILHCDSAEVGTAWLLAYSSTE
jgi:hypothetical protein